jgi:transposase
MAPNYLPPSLETEGNAPLSPADTPLAVESARQDLMEPLLTETTVFAPPLCPDWLDTSPVAGKRRVFSAEEKARIVAESVESGQSVCSVARRHRLRASQLFAWRKSARLQRERRDGDSELLPTEPGVNKCGDAQPSLARQAGPAEIATGRGVGKADKGAAAITLKEGLSALSENT